MNGNHSREAGPGKRVGIWIRVSTEDQAQGDSPKNHEARARGYASSRGWEVVTVYDLAGVSGKSVMDHPEAKRMMEDVRRGHITGLIFSKLARLARNTVDLLKFSEYFSAHGADLMSIYESIDTTTPAGRLFFTVNASLAQFEREEIASRVAASVPIRAKLGKPLGGQAPYGYEWKAGKLVVNEADAAVRRLAYELFADLKRKKAVSRALNERGYRTRGGGKFSDTTVHRLLTDPTAKGEHRANYTKSAGDGKHWSIKPEHEWVVTKVEPIVSAELWDRCNGLLESRRVRGARPVKVGKSPFTGFVWCHCGKSMTIPSNTPKWVCQSCRNKIPAADMDALFRDQLHAFAASPDRVAEYLARARGGVAEKRALAARLRADRDRLKAEADKCFELYQAGAVNVEQFKERFQPLDIRRREIEAEAAAVEGEAAALSADEVSQERVAAEGGAFYEGWPKYDEGQKRNVVELVLKSVVVGAEDVSVNLYTLPVFEVAAEGQRTLTGSSRRRA